MHFAYCFSGGVACFKRPGSDLQYFGMVAGVALELESQALLLLVAPADESGSNKGQQQPGVFLLAGNPGSLHLQDQKSTAVLGMCIPC